MSKLVKDNFYYGFAGEHHVISQFYAMHFEATKMEVDFGFDVLVTNQYRYSKGKDKEIKTQAYQVKTATVYQTNYIEIEESGVGVVKYAQKDFYLKKDDFNLISNKENGYLVCVFVEKRDDRYHPLGLFWLSNKHLKQAKDLNFLKDINDAKYGDCYVISARIALHSSVNHLTSFYIERLEEEIGLNDYIADLKDLLFRSDVVPHTTKAQIQLVEEYKIHTPPYNSFSYGTLTEELYSLVNSVKEEEFKMIMNEDDDYYIVQLEPVIEEAQLKKLQYEVLQGKFD